MAQQHTLGKGNTSVQTDSNGVTTIRYHDTDIVSFNNRIIRLNTGGWFTASTKTRMNQASNQFDLRYKVYQKAGDWFVEYRGNVYPFKSTGDRREVVVLGR